MWYTTCSGAGMGRPGHTKNGLDAVIKRKNASVFPEKSDSGLGFGKAVAYLLCIHSNLKGVFHWQKN